MPGGKAVKVGITGGLGSGKSMTCRVFEVLGIQVYSSDRRARELMEQDESLRMRIAEEFSERAYHDGKLDSRFLAGTVFNAPDRLEKLNAIVHPRVAEDFKNWYHEHCGESYILKEAALLFESGSYRELDTVILVSCPLETRMKRVMLRDTWRTKEEIEKIIENQMADAEKKKLAYFIIRNDDHHPVIPQILEIHHRLLTLSGLPAQVN